MERAISSALLVSMVMLRPMSGMLRRSHTGRSSAAHSVLSMPPDMPSTKDCNLLVDT